MKEKSRGKKKKKKERNKEKNIATHTTNKINKENDEMKKNLIFFYSLKSFRNRKQSSIFLTESLLLLLERTTLKTDNPLSQQASKEQVDIKSKQILSIPHQICDTECMHDSDGDLSKSVSHP
jgi:hypothetical protein